MGVIRDIVSQLLRLSVSLSLYLNARQSAVISGCDQQLLTLSSSLPPSGQKSIRPYWRNYYDQTDALVRYCTALHCTRFDIRHSLPLYPIPLYRLHSLHCIHFILLYSIPRPLLSFPLLYCLLLFAQNSLSPSS